MPILNVTWEPLSTTSLAATMVVNGLVTSLIVFRILEVFLEVEAASTSVERTLGSAGGTKFRHIIFVIIESGMTLLIIQVVRLVLGAIVEPSQFEAPGLVTIAIDYFVVIGQMFNVIIRSVQFTSFVLLKIFTWVGHHTYDNFGADLNEIVLR